VLAAFLGLAWMYAANQKKDQELAALREDSQQLQQLRAEVEEAKTTHAQSGSEELARLRKENEELLRLRNEVRQLRGDKQQLNTQLQTAQSQAQGIQAQMEVLRATTPQPGAQNPAASPAQAAFAARYNMSPATMEQANTLTCQNNLRAIQGAKQQWATEHQKPGSALLTQADLLSYVKSNTVPVCPSGGIYTLNPVSIPPICNISGHTIGR
jgi:DNA repair exonuclease SbcCD ATPase subunit